MESGIFALTLLNVVSLYYVRVRYYLGSLFWCIYNMWKARVHAAQLYSRRRVSLSGLTQFSVFRNGFFIRPPLIRTDSIIGLLFRLDPGHSPVPPKQFALIFSSKIAGLQYNGNMEFSWSCCALVLQRGSWYIIISIMNFLARLDSLLNLTVFALSLYLLYAFLNETHDVSCMHVSRGCFVNKALERERETYLAALTYNQFDKSNVIQPRRR